MGFSGCSNICWNIVSVVALSLSLQDLCLNCRLRVFSDTQELISLIFALMIPLLTHWVYLAMITV